MEITKIILLVAFVSFGAVLAQDYAIRRITDCKSAGLCCESVNNTCFVPNSRKISGQVGNCYCDAKCLQMEDCCVDFKQTCKARDCQMGEWTAWSECSNTCGRGHKHRKRAVIQEAAFGGKPCATSTRSKRVCNGVSECLQQSVEYSKQEMMGVDRERDENGQEVGYVIPANFSVFRVSKNYSPQHDIRKNLFFKNFQDNIIPRKPVYSAVFKITHAGLACQKNPWAKVFQKGSEVCVECQPTSMIKRPERCRGHGVFRQETTWKAIEARNCHGKWKMITHHQYNTCNHQGDHDFVLV